MSKVYWVLMYDNRSEGWKQIFVATRMTEKSAVKLAATELLSNRWPGYTARVYEAVYDSYGNFIDLCFFDVSRTGRIIDNRQDLSISGGNRYGIRTRMRRQYGIDRNGHLVKNKVEPAKYSIVDI